MAPEVAYQLPATVHSPEQLKACVLELERLAAWRRRQDVKAKGGFAASTDLDFELSPSLVELIGPTEVAVTLGVSEIDAWQHRVEEWLEQPVTHITFAASPPPPTRIAIVEWFRRQVSPNALVKFSVNRHIVGGMVVRTPNRIFDFSFRRHLMREKSLIPELFRRV